MDIYGVAPVLSEKEVAIFLKYSEQIENFKDNLADYLYTTKLLKFENNPKFTKAKAFRLIDLVVINLFLVNRGFNAITKEDYKIIDETKIIFKEYSEDKIKKLTYFKEKIISNNPY